MHEWPVRMGNRTPEREKLPIASLLRVTRCIRAGAIERIFWIVSPDGAVGTGRGGLAQSLHTTALQGGRSMESPREPENAALPRFVVVVPPERPEVYEQLQEAMSGEPVSVIVDRRHDNRRHETDV